MEEIKNVIVEQKDIIDIINSLNDYYKVKEEIFNETDKLIKEEDDKYKEWNKLRFESDDISNYPPFKRQTFQNKRSISSLYIDISYSDGSTLSKKTPEEFMTSLTIKSFSVIDSILINLDISYQKEYNADEYITDPRNRVYQSVYLKFTEDSIYYSVSGENCDAEVTDLKLIILNKFNSLEPRLSDLITKRNKFKYRATLATSFIISTILVVILAFVCKNYITFIDIKNFKYLFYVVFVVLGLFLNSLIPPIYLTKLYSLIIPKQKQEYSSYDRKTYKVDNIKDFISYPEIQIGNNEKKAGVRQTIRKYIKKQKIKNIFCFCLSIVVITLIILVYL